MKYSMIASFDLVIFILDLKLDQFRFDSEEYDLFVDYEFIRLHVVQLFL